MRSLSIELKVGIFAIVVLVILSFMTLKIGGFEWVKKKGYTVHTYFNNVTSIDKRTKVKVAGVDAGIIDDIILEGNRAKLNVRMYEGIQLYSDATAYIKTTGLLGDRFMEIKPGSKMPLLQEGGLIGNSVDITDMDDLLRRTNKVFTQLGDFSESLNEAMGSPDTKEAVRQTILNLRDVTKNLNTAVTYNDTKLRKTLDSITELAASLSEVIKTNREPLADSIANLKDVTGNLKTDAPALIKNLNKAADDLRAMVDENRPGLKSTVENLDKITGKIDKGQGTVGKLVNDDKLYTSVNKAAEGLNKTLDAIDRFKTFVTFQGEYLSRPKDGKGYFYVTLQPSPEKYYLLGVVGDPVGRVTSSVTTTNGVAVTEEKVQKKIEFTAQFGRRFINSPVFKDTAVRIGLVENSFGIGVDQFYLKDRLKVYADAWDFTRDENGAKAPHLKVGVDYFLFKHIFVSGGADNILNSKRRGGYVGSGVRFEDEDLKYLFGNMPRIPGK